MAEETPSGGQGDTLWWQSRHLVVAEETQCGGRGDTFWWQMRHLVVAGGVRLAATITSSPTQGTCTRNLLGTRQKRLPGPTGHRRRAAPGGPRPPIGHLLAGAFCGAIQCVTLSNPE